MMARFSLTKRINAPLETVFEVATDLQRAADHLRGVEKIELLTTLPITAGTRWRETRSKMGRQHALELEVTDFDPPYSYTVAGMCCGSQVETTFRFAALANDATRLSLEARCEARSLGAKLMSPFTALVFGKKVRQARLDDLEDMKRVAESRTQEAP